MFSDTKARRAAQLVLIAAALGAPAAWSQVPVISAVVDAASYGTTAGVQDEIVTVFGTNLAAATATAQMVPLPLGLGGTTVSWGGVAAPLFYVSPTQINFEVPRALGYGVGYGVVVSTGAGSSAPFYNYGEPARADPPPVGLFSSDGSGCGQAVALNENDGTVNSRANSVSPGQWVSLWGTAGLSGPIGSSDMPAPGAATPLSPLYSFANIWPEFDFSTQTYTSSEFWSGFAPGLVGVNQFNVQIPASTREGCAVPVQLSSGVPVSQPLTLAIRNGGGPCVDPPEAGYGQIVWQKTVNTTATQQVTESDTLTVSLQSSPGMQAPPPPVYAEGGVPDPIILSGPSCPVAGYRSLGAGAVSAQGPGFSPVQVPTAPFPQGQVGGLSAYQATLPAGTALQAGTFSVSANGGADVGAFQATAQLPADIQIQTRIAGASLFANCQPLTVEWTGGDPNAWVSVIVHEGFFWADASGEYESFLFSGRVRASGGSMSISGPPGMPVNNTIVCPAASSGVVSVEVDPDPSEITTFSAPGLTLGGQVTWKYIHTFQASPPAN